MFTNEELKKYFSEDRNEPQRKSKWYVVLNYISLKDENALRDAMLEEISKDKFWSDNEKTDISRVLRGEKIFGWIIERRTFGGGEHLDFCVIYYPSVIQQKLKANYLLKATELKDLKAQIREGRDVRIYLCQY